MCLTSSGYSGISSFANSKKIDHNLLSTPSVLSVSRNESASMPVDNEEDREDVVGGKKKKEKSGGGPGGAKRRKVNHACVYCRRSHMTCDEDRPCKRCIKRDIGHLCHDERKPPQGKSGGENSGSGIVQQPPLNLTQASSDPSRSLQHNYGLGAEATTIMPWNTSVSAGFNSYGFPVDTSSTNNEFSFLTEFLENLDEASFFNVPHNQTPIGLGGANLQQQQNSFSTQQSIPMEGITMNNSFNAVQGTQSNQSEQLATASLTSDSGQEKPKENTQPILPSATKKERFLLIAADQGSGSPNERLNRVIQAKYEAGLLKPYNYVKGYARLSKWMDRNVSQDSKQQILQPLSILRPKFRAVAQTLRDMDLVFIEEAFERLLLDYDRVFSAMAVPACLWRRTGEIYKGNRQFAELVGVDDYMLRDGRLCIYEVMAEESAVNYWEKYGQIAFDSSQKAVLTSCVLRYKPVINLASSGYNTPVSHRKANSNAKNEKSEEGFIF
ncbi:zinc cluster transcriptional activator [Pyrrhoderma noxium]|uniref:Zinc cluster transcriptional activator n=1 Tax=Pyrrhoderma noxium TaxID=2282107 RepID=A0A286UFB4_9AGAM|nr:zinc cluster transcriptional activator [Pyrrhoderma noxium]